MGKQRDRRREAFWRRMLRRQARSGMTISEFCVSEGLKTTTYHFWRREIERRDAESPAPDAGPEFAAVQLVDDRSCGAAVEIVAGNGYLIRVSEQATTEQLRRVPPQDPNSPVVQIRATELSMLLDGIELKGRKRRARYARPVAGAGCSTGGHRVA